MDDDKNVKDRRQFFEMTNHDHLDMAKKKTMVQRHGIRPRVLAFFKESRLSGLPLALFYGLFIYYYSTFLILGPISSNNLEPSSLNETRFNRTSLSDPCMRSLLSDVFKTTNMTAEELDFRDRNHWAGGMVGVSVGGTLGVMSVFSRHTRCSMMLIVPGIFAGRGRSFMLTAAMGLLIDGPIGSINYNIEQVIQSLTCMYDQMRILACQYDAQFRTIFDQVGTILEDVYTIVKEQRRQMAEMTQKLTGELKAQAEKRQRQIEKQLKDLDGQLGTLRGVINAPGNVLSTVCNGVRSVISTTGKLFSDAGKGLSQAVNKIKNFFGRRRKRADECSIPPVVPNLLDVDVPGLNMEALQEWIKTMFPDFDVLDLDLNDFKDTLKSNSIVDIRAKIIGILRNIFVLVQDYSNYLKKVFYLVSLFLVILDAFTYLQKYWSDDSFDNMYVDDNLRRLWRVDKKEKLTPLRNWELSEKYQMSSSMKISKKEAKRILIKAIPTMVFTSLTMTILVMDYALANLLSTLLKHGEFGISFAGMEQGLNLGDLFGEVESGQTSLASLRLEGFDLSTEPCLPRPKRTRYHQTGILALIVVTASLSCIFDAYASRWRAIICNFYYNSQALERGEYLFKKIKAGRGNRRFQMKLVINRELKRRERLKSFSWWSQWLRKSEEASDTFRCPSCFWKTLTEKGMPLSLRNMTTPVCSDCFQDF